MYSTMSWAHFLLKKVDVRLLSIHSHGRSPTYEAALNHPWEREFPFNHWNTPRNSCHFHVKPVKYKSPIWDHCHICTCMQRVLKLMMVCMLFLHVSSLFTAVFAAHSTRYIHSCTGFGIVQARRLVAARLAAEWSSRHLQQSEHEREHSFYIPFNILQLMRCGAFGYGGSLSLPFFCSYPLPMFSCYCCRLLIL